jgi:AAA domain
MSTIPVEGDPGFLVTRCASEITLEPVEWLWPRRLAKGKHTCIAGEPGAGKSQLSTYIAAQISMGRAWPCGEGAAPQGSVLILSAEDGLGDTIAPRLHAADADCGRVHIIERVQKDFSSSRGFNLQADIELLEHKIKERGDVALVTIDPISSYLGKVDSHKNAEVRSVLEPLSAMAERTRVAVLSVTHFSKTGAANSSKAINRFIGSIAFTGAPRVALAVVEDSNDSERRLFLSVKNNLAPAPQGLAYRLKQTIVGEGIEASRVDWEAEPVLMNVNDALADDARRDGARPSEEAESFLREQLADEAVPARQIKADGDAVGLSWSTLKRAKARLRIDARKDGMDGGWLWSLPKGTKLSEEDQINNVSPFGGVGPLRAGQ